MKFERVLGLKLLTEGGMTPSDRVQPFLSYL